MRELLLVQVILLLGSFSAFSQSSAEVHVKNMQEFRRQGKYVEAVDEISKAIALEPNNAQLLIDRAMLYHSLKDDQSLDADVEKAVFLAPNDERIVLQGIVTAYLFSRQCEKALPIIDAFIGRNPQNDRGYAARSTVYSCLRNFPAALNDISLAQELGPQQKDRYQAARAGVLSQMGNSDGAMEIFRSIIGALEAQLADEQRPEPKQVGKMELAGFYSRRARIHDREGRSESAIADYSRAFELHPHPLLLRERAMAYQKAKNYQSALADFDRVIAEDKAAEVSNYISRGNLYMLMENYEKAISDFEHALKQPTPIRPVLESKIAEAKRKLGQMQQ